MRSILRDGKVDKNGTDETRECPSLRQSGSGLFSSMSTMRKLLRLERRREEDKEESVKDVKIKEQGNKTGYTATSVAWTRAVIGKVT